MTMLTAIKTSRKLGLDVSALMAGLSYTEGELEAGRLFVPWDDAATFLNRLEPLLTEAQVETFMVTHMLTHPTIRMTAQFASSTSAWLDLFWRLSATSTDVPAFFSYSAGRAEHRLVLRSRPEAGPCRLWFLFTHHSARLAPLLTGDEPLVVRSLEVSGTSLDATYEPPADKNTTERLARASEIPLGMVFDSLALLGPSLRGFVRDGHLSFEPDLLALIDEAAGLVEAWGLTPTEARVTLSLAEGRTPAQVAEALELAVGTVRVHLRNVYAKTDTDGQRELLQRVRAWRLE